MIICLKEKTKATEYIYLLSTTRLMTMSKHYVMGLDQRMLYNGNFLKGDFWSCFWRSPFFSLRVCFRESCH